MSDRRSERSIDVNQVVRYLSHAFSKATQGMGKATRTVDQNGNVEATQLYQYQVDFCYLIDAIERSPKYIVPKIIAEANDLIDKITAERKN